MEDNEIKALVSLISDNDPSVLGHVESKLLSLGKTVIPFLETEWETQYDADVQKRIEDIVHQIQLETLSERLVAWRASLNPDLLEGIWLVNTYQYPELSIESLEAKIQEIVDRTIALGYPDKARLDVLKDLNEVFFNQYKFRGNTKDFSNPSNSYLNLVFETKKGSPISLCIIYMLAGRRLGLPLYGVNLPNLFVLSYIDHEEQFYINVFNRGIIFSKNDIDSYVDQLRVPRLELFYQPCGHAEIVKRVLRNLAIAYDSLEQNHKKAEIYKLLNIIASPDDPDVQLYS